MKLVFEPETDDEFAAIVIPDGRPIVLDCHEGPEDDKLMRDIAHRYNNWDEALEALKEARSELFAITLTGNCAGALEAEESTLKAIKELEDET
jgi:hypothetical protein